VNRVIDGVDLVGDNVGIKSVRRGVWLVAQDGAESGRYVAGRQVKLSKDVLISDEKLTKDLLAPRRRNDKSRWLAQAGYHLATWSILRHDLLRQILPNDASLVERTPYGEMDEIRGTLKGPNGKTRAVCTIWMTEKTTQATKFITMYPDRKQGTI